MKNLLLLLSVVILFPSILEAKSRVLIGEEEFKKCVVENDGIFFTGIMASKIELETLRFLKFDSITFVKSIDDQSLCKFQFDLSLEKKYLGRAEIVLSKNNWQIVSRKISNGNSVAR